jgi:hypothetical protein
MYPRFSCLVPLIYLLSQVVSCVSVFLGYPFLNVSSVFLFGPFSLITFTGCVLCVRVSMLSVLECTLGFPVWSLWFTYFHRLCLVCPCFWVNRSWMYPWFSSMVPLVYLLSQVVSLVSVFLCFPFLNVPSVFLFGPFSLLTFTGCVLCVRVSGLSVLECTLGFPVWSL